MTFDQNTYTYSLNANNYGQLQRTAVTIPQPNNNWQFAKTDFILSSKIMCYFHKTFSGIKEHITNNIERIYPHN